MINHNSRESFKFFESIIDTKNAEELERTKTDIESNITRILKFVQSKKDGNPKRSKKETEFVGLIEDLDKQYRSLNALYDRFAGEFEKVVSHRRNGRTSVSSSDSDSEYFSSEEVDVNNTIRSEIEHHNVFETQHHNHHNVTKASAEAMKLEGQITSLMKEMESLSEQKGNLELQVESQANEVKQLSAKNTELQEQVVELELFLKEEKCVVSNLQAKLDENENKAKSNVAKLMAQVNELEHETKSLRTQKDEMEERIKCGALKQTDQLMEQLNVMQNKLDSLGNLNRELKVEMNRKKEQITQYQIQIENLEENVAETKSIEKGMVEQKEGFLARIKDLEHELETQSNQRNELEEELRSVSYEMKQVENENKTLHDRNCDLEAAMAHKGDDMFGFLKKHESHENEACVEATALKAELEHQNERNQKEHAESLTKMETLNVKLETQIAEQEKIIKDQAATIDRISAEEKQAKIMLNRLKFNPRFAEKKMEELVEELRKKMEDSIRLLHQRIHVAEQLNNENKNSCKMTKERYEEENKILGEKVACYEEKLRTRKEGVVEFEPNRFELSVINGLNVAAEKVEEHSDFILSRVSKMLCEVESAKDWIKKRSGEMKELKDNVNEKEEQLLLLREKVWELEAKVSKEGGEKLNLTKTVRKLEKKVGKLENNLKEKDEDLICLGEKKREGLKDTKALSYKSEDVQLPWRKVALNLFKWSSSDFGREE
ncbi:COP1-interactive protein 1-like [Lotus japonicus]|uniref:COP1-interactive protein 1-like n=1 Tax=Lotus japonicus TaxID=34305 RepID=UPI002582C504|nr:COP1-interactive protein 1-like [Lotus japonicus]